MALLEKPMLRNHEDLATTETLTVTVYTCNSCVGRKGPAGPHGALVSHPAD